MGEDTFTREPVQEAAQKRQSRFPSSWKRFFLTPGGAGGGDTAQKAPTSVTSETQEWQSTAPPGFPAGPEEEGLGAGAVADAGALPTPGDVGGEDRRRGAMWLLLEALPLGATGRGTAGLSRGRALRIEDAPRLGSRCLRAGRTVPAALRKGTARRAGMGQARETAPGRTGPGALPRMASWLLGADSPGQLWKKDQGQAGKARGLAGVGAGSISAA